MDLSKICFRYNLLMMLQYLIVELLDVKIHPPKLRNRLWNDPLTDFCAYRHLLLDFPVIVFTPWTRAISLSLSLSLITSKKDVRLSVDSLIVVLDAAVGNPGKIEQQEKACCPQDPKYSRYLTLEISDEKKRMARIESFEIHSLMMSAFVRPIGPSFTIIKIQTTIACHSSTSTCTRWTTDSFWIRL